MVLLFCVVFTGLFAQEDMSGKMISIDTGAGISMAFIETDNALLGFLTFLFGMRGIYFADARFLISDMMSAGAELGIAAMSVSFDDGATSTLFLDLPIRGIFRFGKGGTFIQAYAGLYMPVSPTFDTLFDVGIKGSLGGLYTEVSYLMGTTSYARAAIGFALNDIVSF